ncbi:MAG: hypothetical protein E7214_15595 [Clostridium sp.]|nr:hypothetical protein [Clostridium sp.]
MKKYLINKDFIPKEFINYRNSIRKEKDKKCVLVLLFLSFLLFPLTLMNMLDKEEEKSQDIGISTIENNDVDIDLWVDIIEKYNAVGEFNPYEACIYLEGEDKLEEISHEDKININSMEDLGENKYRIQISKK